MEELIEPIFRFTVSFIRFVVQQIIIEGVVYGLGYISLKIITFGRYPTTPLHRNAKDHVFFAGIAAATGIALLLMLV